MTDTPRTPEALPTVPAAVSPYGIPDYARRRADSDRQQIEAVLSTLGLKPCRGTVVEVDTPNSQIRVRRVTAGTLGVDDEEFYPVRGGSMPEVGDHVYGFESSGGPVFLGNLGGGASAQAVGSFSAYKSADQTDITTSTFTQIQYEAEDWDVSGWYNTTTFRYTPLLEGYYSFNASCHINPVVDQSRVQLALYRGVVGNAPTEYMRMTMLHTSGALGLVVGGSAKAYANGTNHFFEMQLHHNFGVNTSDIVGGQQFKFQGEYIGGL